jgi:hypothetical protein
MPSDLAIDPATLTAALAANQLAELVDDLDQYAPPPNVHRDVWDQLVALAAAWRQHTGWGDEQDIDRNAYSGQHLADEDPDASYLIVTPRWPAEAVAA